MFQTTHRRVESRRVSQRNSAKSSRRCSLMIENLESRQVMSGSPLAADADESLTTPTACIGTTALPYPLSTRRLQKTAAE